ncbi:ROK family protein [Cnuibacter sp. UC19_7]|uniref:ROK family protein n=1 Tax=Cnuibacter sp. UC19_7 TaxID=3350166 RepID=UPI00366C4694
MSKATGMSKQTVSLAIAELEDEGFVTASAIQQGQLGRSATVYDVAPRAGWLLGIDMGSTHIRVAASSITGHLILERERAVPDAPNRANADMAAQARDVIASVVSDLEPRHGPLRAACLALSRAVAELRDWQEQPPADLAAGDLPQIVAELAIPEGIAVYAENNVNCAAVGELRHGCAVDRMDIAYLQVGVGLGAGIIADGRVLRGAWGHGGELRKLPLPFLGPSEGSIGSQDVLSSEGLIRLYNSSRGDEGGTDATSSTEVFDRAQQRMPRARKAIQDEATGLAFLAAALIATASPTMVIVGGGMGRNRELLALIEEQAAGWGLDVPIRHGDLAEAATVAGAAAIAAEQFLMDLLGAHAASAISGYRSRWSMPTA